MQTSFVERDETLLFPSLTDAALVATALEKHIIKQAGKGKNLVRGLASEE